MFAILMFVFSLVLFTTRLIGFSNQESEGGYHWAIIDFLSALFFFIGFFYISFPPSSITTTIAYTANVPACTAQIPDRTRR